METLQTKLFEAATLGSIDSLQQLLDDDPLILDRAVVNYFNETPLHVAAMLGHIDFVKEMILIKSELIYEVNSQQSTALHLAAAKGHVEVVRALLSYDRGTCLSLDRNKMTPLHVAATKGRVEVVKLLVEAQPDATYQGESILHLCVKRYQLEAMKVVVKSLGDEVFVNSKDENGNTILHLAVAEKQVETVRFLLSVGLEVNAVNEEGMTTLDVLIRSKRDVRDPEIEKLLKHENLHTTTRGGKKNGKNSSLKQHEDWLEKTKSSLMVVAVLIATMAFQIGVNPPGGVWEDDKTDGSGNPVQAGSSIFAHKFKHDYELFCITTTIAFIASLSIILFLMSGFPLRRRFFMGILMVLTWIAISAIAFCYLYAIAVLTITGKSFKLVANAMNLAIVLWVILMAVLLITHIIRMLVKLFKKTMKCWRRGGNNNIPVTATTTV